MGRGLPIEAVGSQVAGLLLQALSFIRVVWGSLHKCLRIGTSIRTMKGKIQKFPKSIPSSGISLQEEHQVRNRFLQFLNIIWDGGLSPKGGLGFKFRGLGLKARTVGGSSCPVVCNSEFH